MDKSTNESRKIKENTFMAGLSKLMETRLSGQLIGAAQEASIVASITDGEYVIAGAKIVKVGSITDPTIGPYTPGGITYADLTADTLDVDVDQKEFLSFKVEDIDQAQTGVDVKNKAIQRGGVNLALKGDKYAFGLYGDAGYQINNGATPTPGALDVNSKNINEVILNAGRWFDEHNVPLNDRNLVMAPWFKQKLIMANILREGAMGDGVYANGYVGQVLGFKLYVSNQLTAGHMLAMTSRAIAFGSQINKVEALRLQDSFADAIRALYTFGAAVIYPEELVDLWVAEDAES